MKLAESETDDDDVMAGASTCRPLTASSAMFVGFLDLHLHLGGPLCRICSQVKDTLIDASQKDKSVFIGSNTHRVMVTNTNEGASEGSTNNQNSDEEIQRQEDEKTAEEDDFQLACRLS